MALWCVHVKVDSKILGMQFALAEGRVLLCVHLDDYYAFLLNALA